MKEIKIATANINRYKKAIAWIEKNTIKNSGITVTSKQKVIYPEVTGYYIPTLIRWGKKELANKYADYLISIQKEDGSWYDSQNHVPYIFDSGQILKGLIAIYPYQSTVKENIIRGCEWILSRENKFGRLVTPSKDAWGCDKHFCDEYVHLYCLEPILKAGKLFGRQDFIEAVNRIKKYYINEYKDRILHFDMLSHFHAYVMEALVDLGEIELARTAMHNIERYQKKNGSIPGLNSVNWICSTGLFQLAIVWFKLGNVSCGNNAFEYACKLQNSSGGWYGSYSDFKFASVLTKIKGVRRIIHKHVPIYFPNEEISWAVKYFLDALYFKSKSNFDTNDDNWKQMSIDKIPESDERYKIIEDAVSELPQGGGDNS